MGDFAAFSWHHFRYTIPDDVMAAWDDACLAAFQRGEKPVVNLPIGLFPGVLKSLKDQVTGEWVDINWLPPGRFPTTLPAQYFNPDLITPEWA